MDLSGITEGKGLRQYCYDIAKEIADWFYDHMSNLTVNPEERYEAQLDTIADILIEFGRRTNCDLERQHYRIGYYDENDHWCDRMALYINGERQGQVVVERPRKPYIPYRSAPGDPDRIPFYVNPMSPDYEEPSWEDAILEQQESWYDD